MPRNDYLDEDMPDDEDFPEEDPPAYTIPSEPSRSPSSPGSPSPGPANQSYAPPQKSMPGWNMAKTMCQAGGAGLKQLIANADDAMPPGGLPVSSERAGGESRRTELKRKVGEITRSAAEDFALLTIRTSSIRYAADFLSTVGNVSFSNVMLKYIQSI